MTNPILEPGPAPCHRARPARQYRGEREGHAAGGGGARVCYRDADGDPWTPLPLAPSLSLHSHSPTGFEWGYGGSGPAQLALALLLDATGQARTARLYYQDFKWRVVAHWPRRGWSATGADVLAWLARYVTGGPRPAA